MGKRNGTCYHAASSTVVLHVPVAPIADAMLDIGSQRVQAQEPVAMA